MRSLITDVTKGFLRVYIATRRQTAQNKDPLPLPILSLPPSLPSPCSVSGQTGFKKLLFHSSFFCIFLDCSQCGVIFRVVGDRK